MLRGLKNTMDKRPIFSDSSDEENSSAEIPEPKDATPTAASSENTRLVIRDTTAENMGRAYILMNLDPVGFQKGPTGVQ